MEYSSMETTELASALLRVQAKLKPIAKDRRNDFAGCNYATLLNIMDICKALLFEERIWLTQYAVPAEPGHLGLVTKLTHVDSGQWQAGLSVAPQPAPERMATLSQLERQSIIDTLDHCNGNVRLAAQELGIARSALYNKLTHFGIDPAEFRHKYRY